jgi:subtilisin family serine protease
MRSVLIAIGVLTAAVGALTATSAEGTGTAAYVVVFRDGTEPAGKISELERAHGFRADHRYSASLAGFAARLGARQRDAIVRDAAVASIDDDRPARLAPTRSSRAAPLSTGVKRIGGGTRAATGVAIAVLDTGVDLAHPDLTALVGTNCVGGAGRRTTAVADGNGHGTHVAGIVAGRAGIGVAPGTTIFAVKVLDEQGRGSTSQLICGIDWVTANAARLGIRVANLSLGQTGSPDEGCGRSSHDALHKAICRSTSAGVVFVVAAGNEATDIARDVPSGYPEVLAVAAMSDTDGAPGGRGADACVASERDDRFASFSNYAGSATGAAHLVAAPGVCIRSSWPGGGYRTISGTSMAAPHVSGAVALCIANARCPGAPTAIIKQIRADAAAHRDGFAGDERSVVASHHYGDLVWAGGY